VFPVSERWAVTAEGSWNDTLVSSSSDNRRLAVGLRTGAWQRSPGSSGPAEAMPVEIPQVRYEIHTRQRRTGNDFPVADAGPDQMVPADCPTSSCSVTVMLDGSGSFDPDGDPLTYSWTPRSGFDHGEALVSADQPLASFAARKDGHYVIRLTVSDGERSGFDEVAVSVAKR